MVNPDAIKSFEVYCYIIRTCLEQGSPISKDKVQSKLASLDAETRRLFDAGISPARAVLQLEKKIEA